MMEEDDAGHGSAGLKESRWERGAFRVCLKDQLTLS